MWTHITANSSQLEAERLMGYFELKEIPMTDREHVKFTEGSSLIDTGFFYNETNKTYYVCIDGKELDITEAISQILQAEVAQAKLNFAANLKLDIMKTISDLDHPTGIPNIPEIFVMIDRYLEGNGRDTPTSEGRDNDT